MITNKFSFSGALGKSQNLGASKFLSVPNTIEVPPEYSLETDVPSVADFFTCSLNGKLWIFRRSRRFYLAVLRWDEDTQRLVFVNTTILSNENLIRRGVDWILTDKSFIQSSDDEPYFSRSEYNTDNNSYIDAIHRSYSFFPELGTWEEIISEQILHVEGVPSDLPNNIPQSKITPLELHYYSDDDIQFITNFTPKLCYCNGILYAKGQAHIGKVYLLPRSFTEKGEIENFYLYICPDYLRNYDTENQTFDDNDGWNDLIITPLNENSACFFTPDNQDYGYCKKALNAQVTSLPILEHLDFSSNDGGIFFDAITQSNLLLNDSGASLLYDNINYQCKGLPQWIAPAASIESVDKNLIIASDDNFSMATHLDSGFFREKLNTHALPLTSSSYSGKRFAMGDISRSSYKNILVNTIINLENANNKSVFWDNIYKQFFHVFIVNTIRDIFYPWIYGPSINPLLIYHSNSYGTGGNFHSYSVQKQMTDETFTGEYVGLGIAEGGGSIAIRESRTYSLVIVDGNTFIDNVEGKFMFIDLDTGILREYNFSSSKLPRVTTFTYDFDGTMSYGLYSTKTYPCHFYDEHISHSESFKKESWGVYPEVFYTNDGIFLQVDICDYSHSQNLSSIYGELASSTSRYEKVADYPNNGWHLLDDSIKYYFFLSGCKDNYLIFTEKNTNLNFYFDISQTLHDLGCWDGMSPYNPCLNFYNSRDILTDANGQKYILECTHLFSLKVHYKEHLIILRSVYHSDIFDFDSELERSRFS